MKSALALILSLAALMLTGCTSMLTLPDIEAKSLTYHRTDPFGGTVIQAKNVNITDEYVEAEQASWTMTYPTFSAQVTADGYRRKRTLTEKTAVTK